MRIPALLRHYIGGASRLSRGVWRSDSSGALARFAPRANGIVVDRSSTEAGQPPVLLEPVHLAANAIPPKNGVGEAEVAARSTSWRVMAVPISPVPPAIKTCATNLPQAAMATSTQTILNVFPASASTSMVVTSSASACSGAA